MPFLIKFIASVFFATGLIFVQTGLSQEFSYSGKVVDLDGKPISGATVKLKKAGKSTTTADDGSFTLTSKSPDSQPNSINGALYRSSRPNFAALRDGHLEIRLSETAQVSITAFSIGGKILFHKKTLFNAGIHSVSIPAPGQGVYLLRVNDGGQEVTFKTYSLEADILGNALSVEDYSTRALPKQAANFVFDDSLFVTKAEFLDYKTKMYKRPEASDLVIRMAGADHPKMTKGLLYKPGSAEFPSVHSACVEELHDGTLLSVYFGGTKESHPDVEIRMSRLPAGADKWEMPVSVAKGMHGGKKHSTGNPSIFETFEHKLILMYVTLPNGKYRLGKMKTSTDGGKTWSKSRQPCKICLGSEKNKPVQFEDGTILAPRADREGHVDGGIGVDKSTDGGETWGLYKNA